MRATATQSYVFCLPAFMLIFRAEIQVFSRLVLTVALLVQCCVCLHVSVCNVKYCG